MMKDEVFSTAPCHQGANQLVIINSSMYKSRFLLKKKKPHVENEKACTHTCVYRHTPACADTHTHTATKKATF